MPPHTKRRDGDDWAIEDGCGQVIGTAETELLADFMMAGLLGDSPKPEKVYEEDEPYGEAPEDEDEE